MRIVVALIVAFSAMLPLSAQTPGGGWGSWSRLTTAATGMETRVKCEYSFEKDSMWAYQFKNVSGHAVDVVEKEQQALEHSSANGFGAPSMFTLENGAISFPYEGVMHGTCAQVHNLKIEFVCVVPSGQDNPCFRSPDGSLVSIKSNKVNDHKINVASPKTAIQESHYWWCASNLFFLGRSEWAVTSVFSGSAAESDSTDYNKILKDWARSQYSNRPDVLGDTFDHTQCFGPKVEAEAQENRREALAERERMGDNIDHVPAIYQESK